MITSIRIGREHLIKFTLPVVFGLDDVEIEPSTILLGDGCRRCKTKMLVNGHHIIENLSYLAHGDYTLMSEEKVSSFGEARYTFLELKNDTFKDVEIITGITDDKLINHFRCHLYDLAPRIKNSPFYTFNLLSHCSVKSHDEAENFINAWESREPDNAQLLFSIDEDQLDYFKFVLTEPQIIKLEKE